MQIEFHKLDKSYTIRNVSEVELQILARAIEYDRPFSDILQRDIYSRHIRDILCGAYAALLERYL